MSDVLTPTQRSYNMSRIRSSWTRPEIRLHELLISRGLRDFEMHPRKILGRPDFYFPDRDLAVFVDGCFWHGCKTCFKAPASNKKFWNAKIKSNGKRDRFVNATLAQQGINVIRVWEHDLKNNSDAVVDSIAKKYQGRYQPKVLDLFAGAGGFSEGFIRAGCEIVGHVEMDKKACSTLRTRMIYHALVNKGRIDEYKKYILGKVTLYALIEKYGLQKERDSVICAKIGKNNYPKIIEQIHNRLNGRHLDIIIGGPPCQAYSYIGRARDNKNMRWDHRKFLYRYYIHFLKALKPKIFVFENVPGLITSGGGRYLKEMQKLMKQAGYETSYDILDAADFGVPQHRKRVILVGWNNKSKLTAYPRFPMIDREYTVKNFLSGLPKLAAGQGRQIRTFSAKDRLLENLMIINPSFRILMDHVARPNVKRDLEIYKRAVLAKQKGENIKYNTLPKKLKTHQNETGFLDRFKVVDFNATGSHTVVAHMAKDGHFYIHPDLSQNRSLTIREAARLQAFPDDYKFEGERGPQLKQIGNAVPPLLAGQIASVIINAL